MDGAQAPAPQRPSVRTDTGEPGDVVGIHE
jgi:hypothetical protein